MRSWEPEKRYGLCPSYVGVEVSEIAVVRIPNWVIWVDRSGKGRWEGGKGLSGQKRWQQNSRGKKGNGVGGERQTDECCQNLKQWRGWIVSYGCFHQYNFILFTALEIRSLSTVLWNYTYNIGRAQTFWRFWRWCPYQPLLFHLLLAFVPWLVALSFRTKEKWLHLCICHHVSTFSLNSSLLIDLPDLFS